LVICAIIVIFFDKFNNPSREKFQNHPTKKRPTLSSGQISNCKRNPFKKSDVQQKQFMQNLGLLIIKKHLSMQFVEIF
jgi:hypothetical protein